jgi:hypothetical protein
LVGVFGLWSESVTAVLVELLATSVVAADLVVDANFEKKEEGQAADGALSFGN